MRGSNPSKPSWRAPVERPCIYHQVFHWIKLDPGPAEVVHTAQVVGVSAHGDHPSNTLIDGHRGHMIGVNLE